mmetsp:Transcript_16991/g.48552  ORF Transcript_16991/g.48552 Transcript_16991/m.48552 type:complete len:264 (-) Transcript_16991:1088-1879(-)
MYRAGPSEPALAKAVRKGHRTAWDASSADKPSESRTPIAIPGCRRATARSAPHLTAHLISCARRSICKSSRMESREFCKYLLRAATSIAFAGPWSIKPPATSSSRLSVPSRLLSMRRKRSSARSWLISNVSKNRAASGLSRQERNSSHVTSPEWSSSLRQKSEYARSKSSVCMSARLTRSAPSTKTPVTRLSSTSTAKATTRAKPTPARGETFSFRGRPALSQSKPPVVALYNVSSEVNVPPKYLRNAMSFAACVVDNSPSAE